MALFLNRFITSIQRACFRFGAALPQKLKTILTRSPYLTRLYIYLANVQISANNPNIHLGRQTEFTTYRYHHPELTLDKKQRLVNFKHKPLISIIIPVSMDQKSGLNRQLTQSKINGIYLGSCALSMMEVIIRKLSII